MNQFLLIKAALLELGSVGFLLYGEPDPAVTIAFISTHALASAILSWLALTLIPGKYRYPLYLSFSLFMAMIFFIPFFGFFGISVAMVVAMRTPQRRSSPYFDVFTVPSLAESPAKFVKASQYSIGGMRSVLTSNSSIEKKIETVMYTQNLSDKDAIPLLRIALKDQADDVRLLAYSLQDQKESSLNHQIDGIKEELELLDHASAPKRAALLLKLAEYYWELSYLGYSQGELRYFNLERAENQLHLSIELVETAAAQALLAKVYFAQGRFNDAKTSFEYAISQGLDESAFLPYLAEISYRDGEFETTRSVISRLPQNFSNARLAQIREYWI